MKKILFYFLIAAFFPLAAQAQIPTGCWGATMMYPYSGWGVVFMPIFWLVLIGLIIYFIYKMAGGKAKIDIGHMRKGPVDILKERYAKGEINKEQFEDMKKEITE